MFDTIIQTLRHNGLTDSEIRNQFELAMIRQHFDRENSGPDPDRDRKIVKYLVDGLGISSHILGYKYVIEAVMIYSMYQKEGKRIYITTQLYPMLAVLFDTTVSRVEKNIRYGIELAMENSSEDFLKKIFGNSLNGKSKPTNHEFISALADKLN